MKALYLYRKISVKHTYAFFFMLHILRKTVMLYILLLTLINITSMFSMNSLKICIYTYYIHYFTILSCYFFKYNNYSLNNRIIIIFFKIVRVTTLRFKMFSGKTFHYDYYYRII